MIPIVHCRFDEMRNLASLKEHPRNPNTHPPAQIRLLAEILKRDGWRHSIIVSKRSDFVVAGAGRLAAARQAKFLQAPVCIQDFANEEAELAFLVADNRLSILAETDQTKLAAILEALRERGADLALAGFDDADFTRLCNDLVPAPVRELVDQIGREEECKQDTETRTATLKEAIITRLDTIAKNHPDKLASAAAVIIPAGRGGEFLLVCDKVLPDFIAELRRYVATGTDSPLAAILEHVHSFTKNERDNPNH